ncbi:MAG: hypothetical protein MZV63_11320 [Marinilabiliales bacterium]|nr:hypothetical protein [Marinilabiliales bacterium]
MTDELYFVIDEKANSIELTEKGHDLMTESVRGSQLLCPAGCRAARSLT